jgi:aminoglycoside phosphotransferase (APT) family kinase protein
MVEFSTDWFSEYLSFKRGEKIETVKSLQFARGGSRETWFVTFRRDSSSEPISVVFRVNYPGGSVQPISIEHEFALYDRLGRTGLPVAKALWWEDDPRWSNPERPFYVREFIDGDWDIPGFLDQDARFDELRIAISKEHMRKLAMIHLTDWQAARLDEVLPAPKDRETCGNHYVDQVLATIRRVAVETIPIITEASEWLHDNAPAAARVCLCKGTNGLGEEVFRNGEIVALTDWEEASIGDPAADFAFMQNFAPEIDREGKKIWGLEHALDYYNAITGFGVKSESVAFYRIVRALTIFTFGLNSARAVAYHAEASVRQAWNGTEVVHIAKHMLAAGIGLMPPLGPTRFQELNESYDQVELKT